MATSRRFRPKPDRRRALELLAGSGHEGSVILANGANAGHETAAIGPQNSSIGAVGGLLHENVDESAALCRAKDRAQNQGEA